MTELRRKMIRAKEIGLDGNSVFEHQVNMNELGVKSVVI
jgi:hypothetical protein